MNNIKDNKEKSSDKSNLIKIDDSVKKEPKPAKKKIMIKEVTDENLDINKINLNQNKKEIEDKTDIDDSKSTNNKEKTIYINNQNQSHNLNNQSNTDQIKQINIIKDE
jgi:hypothetical protein